MANLLAVLAETGGSIHQSGVALVNLGYSDLIDTVTPGQPGPQGGHTGYAAGVDRAGAGGEA